MTTVTERTPWTVRRLPTVALLPVAGLVWWIVGYLPWLLDGLGREMFSANEMFSYTPMALPLFSGQVSTLVLGAGVGGVAAGLVTLLAQGPRGQRAAAAASGVTVAVAATLIESRQALDATGLDSFGTDDRLVNGLTLIVVVTTLVGLGLGLLGLTGGLGLGLALAALAGVLPVWGSNVSYAIGGTEAGNLEHTQEVFRWLGTAALVIALVVIGLRPVALVAAWIGAVLLAWIIGPTITAAAYIEVLLRPGMGLPEQLGDHLSATFDVWRMAASTDARPLTPWIVAIALALTVALWRINQQVIPSDPIPATDPSQ